MGLLKSMRELSSLTREAKALQRQQLKEAYGSSGMLAQARQFGDMISQTNEQLATLESDQERRSQLLSTGISGQAVIVGMGTPARGANWFNLSLDLEVHVPGRDAYRIASQYLVPASATLGPGILLPVKVDPNDRAMIAIDWSAVPQQPAIGEVRPVTADAPTSLAVDDRVGELERLAHLHQSGALTDAEFQQEKQRILGT